MAEINISIIVPCFKQAKYLDAALQSVLNQTYEYWECIIINDGSPDNTEEVAMNWVQKDKRFKYYYKKNEGLAKARNYAISRAFGEFILPLDADNQLKFDFIHDAITVFENNQQIDVVYGDAEFFGTKKGLWKVDKYDSILILGGNYIDACAVYRKKLWIEIGGYDENMPYSGHEDWEFWVAIGNLDAKFYHLNKITFRYFVSNNSMIKSLTDKMQLQNSEYILKKHRDQCQKLYSELFFMYKNNEIKYINNLKSEKFVIDLFCSTFFGFSFFGMYKKRTK